MSIVTNNQPALAVWQGEALYSKPQNTAYIERRDHQHAMIWDQEPPRMTFAEIPSAEETALIRLFEVARKRGHIVDSQIQKCPDYEPASLPLPQTNSLVLCFETQNRQDGNPLDFGTQNPGLQITAQNQASTGAAPEDIFANAWRLDFSAQTLPSHPDIKARRKSLSVKEATELAEGLLDLVGTETMAHVSCYEKLLRTTSYRVLEGQIDDFKDLPVSDSKRIDASLLKLVESADKVSARQYSNYLSTTAFRCQAFLSLHTRSSDGPDELKKLRGFCEQPKTHGFFSWGCSEARDVLQGLWHRVVSKKNASLSLAVMRRKMRAR